MNATKAAVRNGVGGQLSKGFGDEATPDVEGIAVLGGSDPSEIAEHIKATQQRIAEREEAAKANCDHVAHRDM